MEPWHADVFDFLDLRKNHGKEERRARDLFYGLWIPDLFMQRVEVVACSASLAWTAAEAPGDFLFILPSPLVSISACLCDLPIESASAMQDDGVWSLMCPNQCPGLADCWGEKFEALYTKYESEGKVRRVLPARQVWNAILEAQVETGNPYMLFKDACNRKSNQQNLGTIKSSNLCTEIVEFTSPDETAVCNLASIALPRFVRQNGMPEGAGFKKLVGSADAGSRWYDFEKLAEVTKVVTKNLNKIIDINYYPVETARNSNMRHRPIGLGVQGLADVFILLGMPFESEEARQLNQQIFETIYFAALEASCEEAREYGTYSSYEGSPVSKGILQPDMWGVTPSDRWDWAALRQRIAQHGVRNSLLVAPMPTASTSQILGNNECFEPYTSNIYARRVLSGEFTIVNQHLLSDLTSMGLWDADMKNQLVADNGSVCNLDIPENLKVLYKTAWEIKQRALVDLAADRGAFIDQSQSFNVFMSQPSYSKLSSLHFHTWKQGLKTGLYYLRTRAAADAVKFTVDQTKVKKALGNSNTTSSAALAGKVRAKPSPSLDTISDREAEMAKLVCSLENKENCLMCGS